MRKRKIAILGSTGSIGTQALNVINSNSDKFDVVALGAGSDALKLFEQAHRFDVPMVSLASDQSASKLKEEFKYNGEILSGIEGLCKCASESFADIVLVATTGQAGFTPTVSAIRSGIDIALASKELLVMAGQAITSMASDNDVTIFPIDSEHSAIWQCLQGERVENVHKIILTASGGPLRQYPIEELKHVSPAKALAHPNWDMGHKISIDSATMMNKALEVIEAHWLFGVPFEMIDVLVHPQSIVHSMVQFKDDSVKAQLGEPDMRVPIAYALSYPDRLYTPANMIDFSEMLIGQDITFEKPDPTRYPLLDVGIRTGLKGGNLPAVLCGSDDAAVELFLSHEIGYSDIVSLVELTIDQTEFSPLNNLDEIGSWYAAGYEAVKALAKDGW